MRAIHKITLVPSATRTTSGDTKSTAIEVGAYKEANFFLNVSAVSGTSPTLDVKIITHDPTSGEWFDLVSFTQATGVTKEMKTVSGNLGYEIAVEWSIGGTAPSFKFSVGAVFKS